MKNLLPIILLGLATSLNAQTKEKSDILEPAKAAPDFKQWFFGVHLSAGGTSQRVGYGMDGGMWFSPDSVSRSFGVSMDVGLMGGTDKYPTYVDETIPHNSYRTRGPYLKIEYYLAVSPIIFLSNAFAVEPLLGLSVQDFQYIDESTVTGENWNGGTESVIHGNFGGALNYVFGGGSRIRAGYAMRRGGMAGFSWGLK